MGSSLAFSRDRSPLPPLPPPPPPPTHHFVGGPSPSPWPVCGSPTWLSALFFYLRVDRSRFASSALFPSPPPTHHFGGGPSPSSCPVCGSPTWLSALFFYLRVGRSRFSRRRLSFPPPPSPLTSHLSPRTVLTRPQHGQELGTHLHACHVLFLR